MRAIMKNVCCKIFVWFLLADIFGNVFTGARLNFGMLETSLIDEDSVFINGKREKINSCLSRMNEGQPERDLDLKIIFTFFKCECAYSINTYLESIRSSMKPCGNNVKQCAADNKGAIDDLVSFNKNIKLAVTTLLAISDQYPILKSNESYFASTLLSACLYIESLASMPKPEDKNDTVDSQKTHTVLQNMNSVLLQIMNLVGQFAIEHCYPSRKGKTIENKSVDEHLKNVLTSIDLHISTESVIDMNGLMLANCMQNDDSVNETSRGLDLCKDYIRTAKISSKLNENESMTISVLFEKVKDSYDVASVYEYTLAVYQVVLKLIYLKTADNWTSLDVGECGKTIKKLKSMYCPMELIDHFQLILDMKRLEEIKDFDDIASNFFKQKLDDVKKVSFDINSNDPKWLQMSLSDLTNGLLDDQFKYFWWFFNILYREFDKKSLYTYDMSVNLFPVVSSLQQNDECTALNDVTDYSSTIQSLSHKNFKGLFEKLKKLSAPKYSDFYNVYSAAKIQLKFFKNSKSQNEEIFKRILNSIRNTFDNYAIKNCININVDKLAYRDALSQTYKVKNAGIHFTNGLFNDALSKMPHNKKNQNNVDLNKLTGKTKIANSSSLGTNVYFNWHGEMKSIQNIQTDIFQNMLNIQDLVDYQRLCFQWLLYVIYKTWFIIFEQKCRNRNNDGKEYRIAMTSLQTLFPKLYVPISCQKYARYYSLKVLFYSHIGIQPDYSDGNKMIELVKTGMMSQMTELLGVVKDTSDNFVANVKKLMSIDEEIWKDNMEKEGVTLFPLHSYLVKITDEFNENFEFNDIRLPSFKFTFYYYD